MKNSLPSVDATTADRVSRPGSADYPKVQVLVGPCSLGQYAWISSELDQSRDVLLVRDQAFPLQAWLSAIERRHALRTTLLNRIATRAGCEPEEFRLQWPHRTTHDRLRFWASLAASEQEHELAQLLDILEDPELISEHVFDEPLINSVFQLVSTTLTPSLLFNASNYGELLDDAKAAVSWAEAIPQLTIALVVPLEVWQAYLDRAPASRTKAILREEAQLLPITDSNAAAAALEEIVGMPIPLADVLPDGIDPPLLESVQSFARTLAHGPRTVEESDLARSQAERTLFEFLERWPETAGRFAQNAQLDFQFGPRGAEIDLFCPDARVALEIDGYFHFQSEAAYRRDRAKDWELQRRGYLVLRFLANDILPRIDEIRDRIFAALAPASRSLPR